MLSKCCGSISNIIMLVFLFCMSVFTIRAAEGYMCGYCYGTYCDSNYSRCHGTGGSINVVTCNDGTLQCKWRSWSSWGSCSSTCGGGFRKRSRSLCCQSIGGGSNACKIYCSKSSVNDIDFVPCKQYECHNGVFQKQQKDKFNYGYCRCDAGYGGECCNKELCGYNGRWCWPGNCGSDNYATNCRCDPGFQKQEGRGKTMCQLNFFNSKPVLKTCRAGLENAHGDAVNTTETGECSDARSVYTNLQPYRLSFTIESSFSINISSDPSKNRIENWMFGIVSNNIEVYEKNIIDLKQNSTNTSYNQGPQCNNQFSDEKPSQLASCTGTITHGKTLQNGESICINFIPYAGGFMITKENKTETYKQTHTNRELCFMFDDQAPSHCTGSPNCSNSMLHLNKRVTNDPHMSVSFSSWTDPVPSGFNSSKASGIKKYIASFLKVEELDKTTMVMKYPGMPITEVTSEKPVTFTLPTEPALYAILLEVHDVAGNVRMARRFVLYDNSSSVAILPKNQLKSTTASQNTNFTWQTHHEVTCLNWTGRYYNTYHTKFNLLRSIKADGNISSNFDQIDGLLPVSGTSNVDGIIRFEYTWKIDNGKFMSYSTAPDLKAQSFCEKNLKPTDGQTYTFRIKPVDINSRFLTEDLIVHIDRSPPSIDNIWLAKDGHRQLFVHNSSDLSKMALQFEALDHHSGIHTIHWKLGTTDGGDELGSGAIGVHRINGSCTNDKCYCPKVGRCEDFLYTVNLNKLVDTKTNQGQHNRVYYFSVIVTNQARLMNIEHLDVLADDSPPEEGIIQEGAPRSPDVDYTSDSTITVNWNGFIDHESGIKFYRIGLSSKCLSINELNEAFVASNSTRFIETDTDQWKFHAMTDGHYVSSIIAYNNAMEPSAVVCSDGITIDSSKPSIENVTLKHNKVMEVLACERSAPYLIQSDLTKVSLMQTEACKARCKESRFVFLANIPEVKQNLSEGDIADHICTKYPTSTDNWYIYIPSAKIDISWVSVDPHSQIGSEEVGIASDPTETSSPDIEMYKETHGHSRYHNVHEGIDRGVPFYIMVRSTNKAGLENVLPLGPIIIDDTPPDVKSQLQVHIDSKQGLIVCAWDNSTFNDPEQKHAVDNVLFKIGAGGTFFTPLLETPTDQKCVHDSLPFCVHYPLSRLQRQDEEKSLNFFFELYVYNMAGHFSTVRSPTFILPSRFPPGHGRVFDIDPSDVTSSETITFANFKDKDVHLTSNKLCAVWTGFHHHKNVTFQVGVGTRKEEVDIIPYEMVETSFKCFNSSILSPFTKYYVTVNATCSGGSNIVSSNGITILEPNLLANFVTVNLGQSCVSSHQLPLTETRNKTDTALTYTSQTPLIIGHGYTIKPDKLLNRNQIQSSDILWMDTSNTNVTGFNFRFRAFKMHVSFTIIPETSNETVNFTLLDCLENPTFLDKNEHLQVFLSMNQNISVFFTRYQAALLKDNCSLSDTGGKACMQEVKDTEISVTDPTFKIDILPLLDEEAYRIGVRACILDSCLPPQFSPLFYSQSETSSGQGISATATLLRGNSSCLQVRISLERSFGKEGLPILDKSEWAVALSQHADGLLTTWFPLGADVKNHSLSDDRCVQIPVYLHRPMYACVKTMRASGTISTKCVLIEKPHPNEYSNQHLYELDANSPYINFIKENLHAEFLGDTLRLLHNYDIDFCRKDTLLFGAIPNADERNITWYLLTDNIIPKSTCEETQNCINSITTKGGHVTFYATHLIPGRKYHICATSNETVIHRELYDDLLEEINLCGNGFLVDGAPPKAGHVQIRNRCDGFVNTQTELTMEWEDFKDRLTSSYSDADSSIYAYSYAIGSYPGGTDVVEFINAGQAESITVKNLHLRNGASYYATVRARDHVNFSVDAISAAVRVDISPPIAGKVTVGSVLRHKFVVSSKNLHIHWDGFHDDESGIRHFYIGIGNQPGIDNILPFINTNDMYADLSRTSLQDGLNYYAVLEAVNMAGLRTTVSSESFVLDSSPPLKGLVRDGSRLLPHDLDFQNYTHSLSCHWDKFEDPHSGIQFYRVGLGTEPGQYDIQMLTGVGLRTEYSWHLHLKAGRKYFATVEGCNGAGLCTYQHSDGVILDDSPPFPGIIHIGISGKHETYQSHRNSISAHWIGFEDPQSDIHYFEWCLTLHKNTCDILPFENILLSSSVFKTQLNLPLQKDIFVKVKAYNNVGMSAEAISDSFKVDDTRPIVIKRPYFDLENRHISHTVNTQWETSFLKIRWKFRDLESPILKHVVRLITHHDGKVRRENIHLGNEDRVTIQMPHDDPLLDGDRYWVTVTACNAAGLCTNETSNDLLIDSSPPLLGGFKPPMTWQNDRNSSRVELTWYGFNDVESGIKTYWLAVGRAYSAADLSNGYIYIAANGSGEHAASIILNDNLSDGDKVVLSIWAINNVGLRSDIGKVTVIAMQTEAGGKKGILKLQKHSCLQEYCNRDCTCAVVGGKCEKRDDITCVTVKDKEKYQGINVMVGTLQEHQTLTASSTCISAHWVPEDNDTKAQIQRYEWSIGIDKPGDGVFNGPYAKKWFGLDLQTNMTYCMSDASKLVHGEHYTVFVNAWYSESKSQMFSSPAVTVDTTQPDIVRGKYIYVSADDCTSSLHFVTNTSSIQVCWQNVFNDRISGILKYQVMAGTTPSGDDLISVSDNGLDTKANFNNLPLKPGTKYFFTVRAMNNVGLMTPLSSDGIVLDIEAPFEGVVFNTHLHTNARFQSNTDSFSASWHGFGDQHSFIHHYSFWLTEVNLDKIVYTDDDVGIETSVIVHGTSLKHKGRYKISVKAWDAAGYESEVVDSEEFTIDESSPQSFKCKNFSQILEIRNYEFSFGEVNFTTTLETDKFYKLYMHLKTAEYLPPVELAIGDHFMTIPLAEKSDHTKAIEHAFLSSYNGTTSFKVNFGEIALGNTSLFITLTECTEMILSDDDEEFPVDVIQISHSRLSICSRIIDPESSIRSVEVGVGTTNGGFQIYPLSTVPVEKHIEVDHESPHRAELFVTAVAHNYAGGEAVFKGNKIVIDHTEPDIYDINAKLTIDEEDNNTTTRLASVTVVVKARDDESGVKECRCILKSNSLYGEKSSSAETNNFECHFTNVSTFHGEVMVPVAVCVNNVELLTRKNGSTLQTSFLKPFTINAHLNIVPINEVSSGGSAFFSADGIVQSNHSFVQARWSGFHDDSGIDHYEYVLREGNKTLLKEVVSDARSTAVLNGLNLRDGYTYNFTVEAVNIGGVHSDPIATAFRVEGRQPKLSGKPASIVLTKDGRRLIDWSQVFLIEAEMETVYELNVGSREGFSDIINRFETMSTSVDLPSTEHKSAWVSVCAKYVTGIEKCYSQTLLI